LFWQDRICYVLLKKRVPYHNPMISDLEQTELLLEGDSDYWKNNY